LSPHLNLTSTTVFHGGGSGTYHQSIIVTPQLHCAVIAKDGFQRATLEAAAECRPRAPFQLTEVITRSNKYRESKVPLQNIPRTQAGWMIVGSDREWQAKPETSA
jgi:hypothetical protein